MILPYYLNDDQQKSLLEISQTISHRPQRQNWLKQRDYLMILSFLDMGLRVGELCGIEIKNINLQDGIIKVMGKGQREREIILSNRLIETIKEYLGLIEKIDLNGTVGPGIPARGLNLGKVAEAMGISYFSAIGAIFATSTKKLIEVKSFVNRTIKPLPLKYLFFNQQGKSMNSRHVFRIIQEIGKKAGIENLYPHALRHTFATNLRKRGGDLLLIKEALGHASVTSTEIYAHLGSSEYKSKIRELINN